MSDARAVLRAAGLAPKRSFGQNFLVSTHAVDAIAEACIPHVDVGRARVLELGAGTGTLTRASPNTSVSSFSALGANQPLPAPGGNYCFSNPTSDPQCAGATAPVCDPATGFCNGCTGPFGGATARPCPAPLDPVCAATGACNPCNGDFGTGSASACQLTGAPYCFLTGATAGSCGTCTTNADCAGTGHGGTLCNVASGTCGTACMDDTQCKATEWCAGTPGICIPKTLNGEHVPS